MTQRMLPRYVKLDAKMCVDVDNVLMLRDMRNM